MVRATCTDRKAPTRFSTPARSTAIHGRRAPVAIEVAIALAVSWNPFVKKPAVHRNLRGQASAGRRSSHRVRAR